MHILYSIYFFHLLFSYSQKLFLEFWSVFYVSHQGSRNIKNWLDITGLGLKQKLKITHVVSVASALSGNTLKNTTYSQVLAHVPKNASENWKVDN